MCKPCSDVDGDEVKDKKAKDADKDDDGVKNDAGDGTDDGRRQRRSTDIRCVLAICPRTCL